MSAVNSSSVGPSKKKPGARGSLFCLQFLTLLFAFFRPVTLPAQTTTSLVNEPAPLDASSAWKDLLADYKKVDGTEVLLVRELAGKLLLRKANGEETPLLQGDTSRTFYDSVRSGDKYGFTCSGERCEVPNTLWGPEGLYERLPYESPLAGRTAINGNWSLKKLRKEAMSAAPPREQGPFRSSDLVELSNLDRAIHLEIRYATKNNFLGAPVYTQARAFLQRPAAEALIRALHKLQPLGYGLLIHDGYRPWYVTKLFWDATPPEGKIFVADPAQGSRHNRGCAVDLTLYDLKTGQPIEMTGGYDEMSPRSFPNYPGGTSLQRWHRDLLRRAMESEGFTVYEAEWWHFDYKDWHDYGIVNIPFEKLGTGGGPK
jgi:D-alanyl-D-alanine dipeptidase